VSPVNSTSGNLKAGTYSQNASSLSSADALNYSFGGINSTANYTVNQLALNASISAGGNTYGSALSAGTASFSNAIVGDVVNPASVVINTAGKLSSSGNLKAGTHTGIQSVGTSLTGGDAANYSFGGATADYTVTPLILTGATIAGVTTVYGVDVAPGAVSFSNLIANDLVSSTARILNPVFSSSNKLKAGSYVQTADALKDADSTNYRFAGATADYTVTPLVLTGATIAGITTVYGVDVAPGAVSFANVLANDVVSSTAQISNPAFSSSNKLKAGAYTQTANPLSGTDAGNYSFAGASANYTVNQANISTISGFTASNKIYDATTVAAVDKTAAVLSNVVLGDAVFVANASGNFSDKNVANGKTVNITGLTLGGADAANYSVANAKPTTLADISVRPTSTWSGAGTNSNWSNPVNWDALPDGANVQAVVIPAAASVVYDSAVGATRLQTLTSSGSLAMTGGMMTVAGSLSAPQFSLDAGTVNGAGSLSVNGGFSQTAGVIDMTGPVVIRQNTGPLSVGAITAASIDLAAPTGPISQTGALVTAGLLTANSFSGSILTHTGNRISSFRASSTLAGNIELRSVGAIDVQGIEVVDGDIVVNNWHGISTSGLVRTIKGNLSMTANSPLTIGPAGVSASGNIALTTTNETSAGNMQINGPITSSAGSVSMAAANNFTQTSTVTAAGGVTASAAGAVTFAPGALTIGSPVSYSAAGVSTTAPPPSLYVAEQTQAQTQISAAIDTFTKFLELILFAEVLEPELTADQIAALVVKEASAANTTRIDTNNSEAALQKKKDKSIIIVEGATCTR
jgi:hypothetical protein